MATKKRATDESTPDSPVPAPADDGARAKGSREAVRRATVILEVLTGVRGTTEGAQALEINLSRYYQLEDQALQGMIGGLEPRPRGRRPKPAEERVAQLEAEKEQLQQELSRAQALLRQAQRSIGLSAPASERRSNGRKGKSKPKRRGKPRAVKVIDRLKEADSAPDSQPTD